MSTKRGSLKIAVYTIALNEEQHVLRWFESAKDADLLLIADTGSTDRTIEKSESLGIAVHKIHVDPWRFDVARNASLALVPDHFDICIQLDMDEVLPPGWRRKVEQAWREGNTWPIYRHVASRNLDGSPRNFQNYFKIHPRKGFIWKYPIHEVLVPQPGITAKREQIDLEVDHIQDLTKSRQSYLSLLEKAVSEMPSDWRMAHYLCREYWYGRNWTQVIQVATSSLKISGGWDVERASSCMWASDAANQLGFLDWAAEWAQRGVSEAPHFYEAWHWMAHISHLQKDWQKCLDSASKVQFLTRQSHHLVKPQVWDWWGYDLIALSSHFLGDRAMAIKFGELAVEGNPDDRRLIENLSHYRKPITQQVGKSTLRDHQQLLEWPDTFSGLQILDVGSAFLGESPIWSCLPSSIPKTVWLVDGDERQRSRILDEFGRDHEVVEEFLFDGKPHVLHIASPETGMTSLLEPNPNSLGFFNGFDSFGKIFETKIVETSRLDDLDLPKFDFVRLDVQGSELTLLKNGTEKLEKCVAIVLEVSFVSLYKKQPEFGKVDTWLRKQGFIPHKFDKIKRWSISPVIFDGNFRIGGNQLLEADIVYIRNPIELGKFSKEQLWKLAAISEYVFQSTDLAIRLLLEYEKRL